MLGRIHILAAQRREPCADTMAAGRDKRGCGRTHGCAACAITAALQDFGGGVREEMAEEKRDKCPGCGRKCTGRLWGLRTISGDEIEIFVFVCDRCCSVWEKVALPKKHRKRF